MTTVTHPFDQYTRACCCSIPGCRCTGKTFTSTETHNIQYPVITEDRDTNPREKVTKISIPSEYGKTEIEITEKNR